MARHNKLTDDLLKQMRELEQNCVPRAEIARLLNVHNSTVTKRLGPVRQYNGLRVPHETSDK